jgi:hypothetical protein
LAAGKGDLRRPTSITEEQFRERWAAVFPAAGPKRRRRLNREAEARKLGQIEIPLSLQQPELARRITTDAGSNLIRGMLEAGEQQ